MKCRKTKSKGCQLDRLELFVGQNSLYSALLMVVHESCPIVIFCETCLLFQLLQHINDFGLLRYFYFIFGFGMFDAAANASRILEGEMFKMTISKPKNGNAQHLRAVQVTPLRTGFQPAIVTLRELYGVRSS